MRAIALFAKATPARRPVLLLLLLPFALLAQPEPRYEIAATGNVMVAMRDGVRLATDIYRPARNGSLVEGKFPVILERTPYNKDAGARSEFYLVSRGYVVVLQDVRGR